MNSCSQACVNKIKSYQEQIESLNKLLEDRAKAYQEQVDNLTRQLEDYSYKIYELKKGQKPLKEKCEAAVKDFKRIAQENSVNASYLIFAKEDIAKLTAELDALKEKYKENEFNIKKFDASRTAVEVLIDEQTKFKTQDKDKKGLGYNEVPPPWNDNYTPPLETNESEIPMEYGKPTATVSVETEQSSQSGSDQLNDTNASTSCAGERLVDGGHKQDTINSETNVSIPAISKTCVDKNVEPINPVKLSDICACSCACGNSLKQNQSKPKSQHQTKNKSQSFGPGPSPNSFYVKRQTCFDCGIAGHIARNCPHRPYVPYYAQNWQNVPRGRSSKRNPSRSRSRDDNWNEAKARRQKARDNKDRTQDSRDAFTRPHWVRSRSSQGSFSSLHLINKPKAKGRPNSKSSAEAPIRSNHKIFKPIYRWVPKGSMPKTNRTPVNSSHSLYDKQDMSWESVSSVDSNGKPSVNMDWVPKTV